MSIGTRIRAARQVRHYTQKSLARKLNLTPQAVSQWERDETVPDAERLREIANTIGADFYWLLEGSIKPGPEAHSRYDDDEPKIWRAPIISSVSAGRWSDAVRPSDLPADTRYIDVYSKPEGTLFALEIMGESMEPTFVAGDVIILDTGAAPLPGDFVVAKLDEENETTFKKYRVKGKDRENKPIIELQPLNPDFPALELSSDSPGAIVGTMVEHRRFRRRK